MSVFIYILKDLYTNSNTSTIPVELYEISHIFYIWILQTQSLDTNWIYIYIYIYSHPQTDCFVVSQFLSVTRHTRRFMLESKLGWFLRQSDILPDTYCHLGVSEGTFNIYIHIRLSATGLLNSWKDLCIYIYIYIYIHVSLHHLVTW